MPGRTGVHPALRSCGARPTTRDVDETPFRFGLERVRELREQDEARARGEFGASLNRRARDAGALAAADELVRRARAMRTAGTAPLSGPDLIARHLWVERLEGD